MLGNWHKRFLGGRAIARSARLPDRRIFIARTASPCSLGWSAPGSETMETLMPKKDFEYQHASSMSWSDWIIVVAGCLAWAFAFGSFAALLITVSH